MQNKITSKKLTDELAFKQTGYSKVNKLYC